MAQAMRQWAGTIAGAALLVGAGATAYSCMYTVQGYERALIFDQIRNGTRDVVIQPGTHFFLPYVQTPIIYDVSIQPFTVRADTGSRDLQTVTIGLRILSRPDETRLPYIYQRLGIDYREKVLNSIGIEVMKSVVAQYDATELITNRENISIEIEKRMVARAETFGLELEDVSIVHIGFSRDFALAIEQKQVAQQQAERAKFVVMKNEQEKTAKIITAEGEAEAAALIAKAMESGPGYITLRRIEAARDIAAELATSSNIVYLPNTSNLLLSLQD